MASLKSSDFQKPASSGPYAGQSRLQIFESKIKDDKPFIIGSTKSGEVVRGLSFDARTKKLTYQNKQKKIVETSYTSVMKDTDFGGGAGSGGGAEDTKYTESLQCYFCSYVFNIAKKKITHVSNEELQKSEKFVNASISLKEGLKNGPANWITTDVYIKTANKLYDVYGTKMKSPVYFHRGSKFMQNIYAAKAECHKMDKLSGNPQAPGTFGNDKWNPGDIWASTFLPTETPLDGYTEGWGMLNTRVLELAQQGKLLGISLKKIVSDTASLTEYNKGNGTDDVTFVSATFGSNGNFFSSIDGYITTSKGKIQVRAFSGTQGWQGEIKATGAAGGKIGGGNIEFYSKMHLKKNLYPVEGNESSVLDYMNNANFLKDFYEMYVKVNSKIQPSQTLLTTKAFFKELDALTNNKRSFMFSKYLVLSLYESMLYATAKQRNKLINSFYKYAGSSTDQSSYYVKLS